VAGFLRDLFGAGLTFDLTIIRTFCLNIKRPENMKAIRGFVKSCLTELVCLSPFRPLLPGPEVSLLAQKGFFWVKIVKSRIRAWEAAGRRELGSTLRAFLRGRENISFSTKD
jgi:hypothetical protein